MNQKRACIYPKDIQRITGRSERYGRKLLNDIKNFIYMQQINLHYLTFVKR